MYRSLRSRPNTACYCPVIVPDKSLPHGCAMPGTAACTLSHCTPVAMTSTVCMWGKKKPHFCRKFNQIFRKMNRCDHIYLLSVLFPWCITGLFFFLSDSFWCSRLLHHPEHCQATLNRAEWEEVFIHTVKRLSHKPTVWHPSLCWYHPRSGPLVCVLSPSPTFPSGSRPDVTLFWQRSVSFLAANSCWRAVHWCLVQRCPPQLRQHHSHFSISALDCCSCIDGKTCF